MGANAPRRRKGNLHTAGAPGGASLREAAYSSIGPPRVSCGAMSSPLTRFLRFFAALLGAFVLPFTALAQQNWTWVNSRPASINRPRFRP